MNIAVILASGQGKRMKAGKNKVLLEINKKPLIYYTIKPFQESNLIDSILLVCQERDKIFFQKIIQEYGLSKVENLIQGGKERQDSGYNAVFYLDEKISKSLDSRLCGNDKENFLLFHNGANPFVSENEIKNSIKTARKFKACSVAHPTKDTIKKVSKNGMIIKTLDRKQLCNMQTPQTIELKLAKKAFGKAREDNFIGTDDVSLVENLGKKVKVIEASEFNFKITTPIDLELAEIIYNKYF
jgi:2-C-methyl-D-erythritol 4-phosphate cytidylyltransferase